MASANWTTSFSQRKEAREMIMALDQAPFNRHHAVFVAALLTALIFDYAKPYTISFVIPGMRAM